MVTSFLIIRCSQPFRPPAPGRNCLSLLVADVNSHSSCVPCQPRKAFTPTKQTIKLTILGSSIYETSAGFQQHLENEIELYWVPQINDTGFQYLRNLCWIPAESRKRNNYTGFHKLTILGSSIYETSAGFQQHLENEIETTVLGSTN